MKTLGLALGGGGLRGLAHIGVLQVLEEHKIKPSFLAGTSAGSIFAAFYACGVSPYEMEKIITDLKPSDYLDYNLMKMIKYLISLLVPKYQTSLNGLLQGKKIEKLIHIYTGGKHLCEAAVPVAFISCDIDTGRKVVFSNQYLEFEGEGVVLIQDALVSEAVRASISIPATFEPRSFDGMQMVDGGIKDIVPAMAVRSMGAEYILAVNLGEATYDTGVQGIIPIISRSLSILTYETSDTEEKLFADMMVFPGVGPVGLDDLQDAPRIIKAGRTVMEENIARLIRDLHKRE